MTRRREIALAGFSGDQDLARSALADDDPIVRATALGALARCDALDESTVRLALLDPAPEVRLRAAELAARFPRCPVGALLADDDPFVAEMAAWACGEHESVDEATLQALIEAATGHPEPLVREASVAALGAIGDDRGRPAVVAATTDKPAIRRRAVIALVAFDGDDVDAALERALSDRDWQVRDAAEELRREP